MVQKATKKHLKSMLKISIKKEFQNLKFCFKNGWFFWRFWLPKSTSKGFRNLTNNLKQKKQKMP